MMALAGLAKCCADSDKMTFLFIFSPPPPHWKAQTVTLGGHYRELFHHLRLSRCVWRALFGSTSPGNWIRNLLCFDPANTFFHVLYCTKYILDSLEKKGFIIFFLITMGLSPSFCQHLLDLKQRILHKMRDVIEKNGTTKKKIRRALFLHVKTSA